MSFFWHEVKNQKENQSDHQEEKQGDMAWSFSFMDLDVDSHDL